MVGLVVALSVGLVLLFALLGPMDTRHTLTRMQRLMYFGVVGVFQVPVCFACVQFSLYVMRNRRLVPMALAIAVTGLIVVGPCIAFLVLVYSLFHGERYPSDGVPVLYAGGFLTFAFGTGITCYALNLRLSRPNDAPAENADDGAEAVRSDLDSGDPESEIERLDHHSAPLPAAGLPGSEPVDGVAAATAQRPPDKPDATRRDGKAVRLPSEIGEDIVYLHVSGHYVEVVTTRGSAIVLMRLADASQALAGRGMQIHRSYWAAFRHMIRLERTDHRTLLHLGGGHIVPVGRTFQGSVRAFLANHGNPADSPPDSPPDSVSDSTAD